LTTPGGVSGELTDKNGGKIEFKAAGTTITIDTNGVSVQTQSKVKVQASQVDVTSGQVNVNAAMSKFSGVVKCDVLQATTVSGMTYLTGAGNVW
jgi:phage gp45-like